MTLLIRMAVGLAASWLLLAMLLIWRRRPVRRQQGFLEIAPRYQRLFRRLGLRQAADFLALPARWPAPPAAQGSSPQALQHVVSGHPDRHVARVVLGEGVEEIAAFLKREHHISWRTRLINALAGAGLLSRSLREARLLQALQREELGGAEWLAVGEDGSGRGFLLVREVPDAIELRTYLRSAPTVAQRYHLARRLGCTLAALHHAGFAHPDLYANHVLVDPHGAIHLLDWQRSHRRRLVPWALRCRDLAALHATLDDALATPAERLCCLRAYLRAARKRLSAGTHLARELALPASWQQAAADVTTRSQHLLRHRHIREKRQPQAPADQQAWICLEDKSLCLTPAMAERSGGAAPDWLDTPLPAGSPPVCRRWVRGPDGTWSLLIQRQMKEAMRRWWHRLPPLPEQQQAALLFRLQRHAVTTPRLLAMGRRSTAAGVESLLLTEPLPGTCSLEAWLARLAHRPPSEAATEQRGQVLRQAGVLLGQLHDASCYLELKEQGSGLAVQLSSGSEDTGGMPAVVLENPESVRTLRRRHPGQARRDVVQLRSLLEAYGGSADDMGRFLAGYQEAAAQLPRSVDLLVPAAPIPAAPKREWQGQSGPGSLWQRLLRGVQRLRQRSDWPLFAGARWADDIMTVPVTDRFSCKQGRSTGRWVLSRPAGVVSLPAALTVYLKRHYRLPWWQGLLATLLPDTAWSPALQEWEHLVWARQQGIPAPEVVAAGEQIGPWGRLRSFLVVEELTGMLPLSEAVPLAAEQLEPAAFACWKRGLLAEMARLARLLHDRRCFHKDLYLCHFYIAQQDIDMAPARWRGRVHLIDLHRMQHHRWTWRLWRLKDLAQMLYSSDVAGVTVRDRLRFWSAYHGTGPRRGRGRWLRWLVILKGQRYHEHNRRQKERAAAGLLPTRCETGGQ